MDSSLLFQNPAFALLLATETGLLFVAKVFRLQAHPLLRLELWFSELLLLHGSLVLVSDTGELRLIVHVRRLKLIG